VIPPGFESRPGGIAGVKELKIKILGF